jgi:lactate permease
VLGFRASGLQAAGAAAVSAALIWLASPFEPASGHHLAAAASDVGVLLLLVAAMILPGVLLVEATQALGAPAAITALVQAIALPRPQAAILVAIGIGVTIESLTGMGVSLLVTVPLLLGLFERRTAIGLGLIGMSLMPWGALAISAHVGAEIAAVPLDELARRILWVSGPVAFSLPLLCVGLAGGGLRDALTALAAGAVLVAAIALATFGIGIEVAGVAGGAAVIALLTCLAPRRHGLATALVQPALRPYLALVSAVVVQKLALAPLAAAGLTPAITTGRVSFSLLASPGLAMLASALLTAGSRLTPSLLGRVAARAWRPIVGIAMFLLAARLLVACGAIGALADAIGGLGRAGSVAAVLLIGALGGFVTGSGVAGNVMFMASAAATGRALDASELFAALQNAASGHAAMASLPIAAIVLAALKRPERGEEARIMRTGLALAGSHLALAGLAALLLLSG